MVSMFRRSHAREQNDMLSSPSKFKATRARQKTRGMIHSMHRRWQSCARRFLWALLASSLIAFWCITFVRPTAWYRDDTGGHFRDIWQTLELRSKSGAGSSNAPIMQGMISTQVWKHQRLTGISSDLDTASHKLWTVTHILSGAPAQISACMSDLHVH